MKSKAEGIYYIRLAKPDTRLDYLPGKILYIGKGDDVETRLAQEMGKKSGPATFFRSMGLLLNENVLEGSGKRKTGYNFRFKEPERIARWLEEHVSLEIEYCNWREREEEQIRTHRPPLNITYNKKYCHPDLRNLRKEAHEFAAR